MLNNPLVDVAVAAANAGGQVTSKYFANLASLEVADKTCQEESQGLVTNADLEAEKAVAAVILKAFPDHQILGEEEQRGSIDAEHLWVIDPLDGTNNFAHGIPRYAVSVGYYRDGQAECGAILQPETGDLYTAARGAGAFKNRSPVKVNRQTELDQAMLAVGFYYDRGPLMRSTLAAMDELFGHGIHGFRRMGTAALDLVGVGLGQFGGYFEFTLSPWDFAAAALFVEEAGGRVTTCRGEELPLAKTSILATNKILHPAMLAIVQEHAKPAAENND
jgi:myo-inositol-1(or 4)-monophosphatase